MSKIAKKYPQYNIHDLQKMPMNELIEFLEYYKDNSDQPQLLMDRILNPLLERAKTIQSLGLGYLNLTRSMDTLS
jgi:excinuclease UvrABC ATPase subunit